MPKLNLELFKTLILNFAYIHSKRRKLGMFTLCQKYQCVCRNKVNWPPIRQFPSFSIFGHVACHVTIIKREGKRKPQDILLGKKIHLVLGLLLRDIASHSYAQNTLLTQALNPFSYYDSIKQFYPNSESACE